MKVTVDLGEKCTEAMCIGAEIFVRSALAYIADPDILPAFRKWATERAAIDCPHAPAFLLDQLSAAYRDLEPQTILSLAAGVNRETA